MPYDDESFLQWWNDRDAYATNPLLQSDPLLSLCDSGKHLWADEHADEYVRRLREGWE